ncbi:hypothetical protein [Candidatus Similichlamydia laticola]|uniref:Uncharacterized protein n=1 Tax=Candidatus Similichlamydia laticola TaxID=2170265 RepID=A0A369KG21_9BACT|nr:hypothetical protein [Candidatus Similichlamydia laticola]RDB31857.1 hypothetical protein HAT2_00037 [Candidatus Similichlamydia laticola]
MSEDLGRKVARLESINDYLESELVSLDRLLRSVGFEEGISSVRLASMETLYFFPSSPPLEEEDFSFPQIPQDYDFLDDLEL